jgi:polyhydroxybutyrate depolymerase
MMTVRQKLKYLLIGCIVLTALFTACGPISITTPTSPAAAAQPGSATNRPSVKKPGDYGETITSGGRTRNYLLHVPPSYDGKSGMALVIVMHGGTGNAKSMAEVSGMSAKADKAGFIAVYPNGTGLISDEKILTWNAGNCCGYALENNVDDVNFIRDLIAGLEKELAIDAARVYATGISNGGMMSYRLACELSEKIAAIAPVAGAMGTADCSPVNPVSLIIFHGTADEHVLYEGGAPVKSIDTHPRVDKPVSYAVDFWVKYDGCSPAASNSTSGHIVKSAYSGGKNNTEVVLYTITGGKHAWPGGKVAWIGGDVPTREISATDLIWEFFSRHPKQ